MLAGLGATFLGRRLARAGWRGSVMRFLGWAALGAGVVGLIALLVALPLTDRLAPLAERAVRGLAKADGRF